MMIGDIDIYILSYNRPDYLREAIVSVLNQSIGPASITVCDNGSKNEVAATVAEFRGQGVQFMGSEQTYSAIWNYERAIAASTAEFVFVMHDDDRLCPDFIKEQIGFLVDHPSYAAVACNGYLINNAGKRLPGAVRSDFSNGRFDSFISALDVANLYSNDICIPFGSVVYRTLAIKTIKIRPEYNKVFDAVLFCDFASSHNLAYQAELLYECRLHSSQDSSNFQSDHLSKLEDFYWGISENSINSGLSLQKKLRQKHTLLLLSKLFSKHEQTDLFDRVKMFKDILGDRRIDFKFMVMELKARIMTMVKVKIKNLIV